MEQSKREGTSVPKIRHIALRATDVEGMANFFINAFGMTVAYRRKNGSIDLSDGTMNLAILPLRLSGHRPGFDHIGFTVDNEDQAWQRLEAAGAASRPGWNLTALIEKTFFPPHAAYFDIAAVTRPILAAGSTHDAVNA